jgi:PiT family inorganic phosphate transporter
MYPEFFVALAVAGVLLTYANGANDNFKGVATLHGRGVLSYRTALVSATVATWLGSLAALLVAGELVHSFSGKGLVDPQVLSQGTFPVAVAGGAALTVLLATRLGLPISTTHALIGALVGAGLSAGELDATRLWTAFVLPLALSPVLAATMAAALYWATGWLRRQWTLESDDCVCLEPAHNGLLAVAVTSWATSLSTPALRLGNALSCRIGAMTLPGVSALDGLGILHCLSGLLVSFARGLNDTPKIAGVLLIGMSLSTRGQQVTILAVACVMALGGLLSSRRVARVMSKEITQLDETRGLAANLVTSVLVLGAPGFGLPVSTTHVSCGAFFGIGASSGSGHLPTILTILASWFITLPIAALAAAILHSLSRSLW